MICGEQKPGSTGDIYMKAALKYMALASTLVCQLAFAANNKHADPVGDLDVQPMPCSNQTYTDLVSTDIKKEGSEFVVRMEVTEDIKKTGGYKEYYFWLDLTHDKRAYQPYDPDSVAWPDLYANYRIFYSLDSNTGSDWVAERIAVQNCLTSNCAVDTELNRTDAVKVSIDKNVVEFRWPDDMLPEMKNLKKFRIGYTTYFDKRYCHGEDDSPQWGQKAWRVNLEETKVDKTQGKTEK